MKKFNLERALAGDQVITREGKQVLQITHFRTDPQRDLMEVYGVLLGVVSCWGTGGSFLHLGIPDSNNDLFMAPVKREGWLNVYYNNNRPSVSGVYKTKDAALKGCGSKRVDTIKIEWEE